MPTSKKFLNLTGRVFGRLTVRTLLGKCTFRNATWAYLWDCQCTCGKRCAVVTGSLNRGLTLSCGCYNKEEMLARFSQHNQSHTAEYSVWISMLARCRNRHDKNWIRYGKRGITVCDRWLSFEAFIQDMGWRPTSKHSIDRINNEGNYEPSNCRWATLDQQRRNMRTNRWVNWNGERMCLVDWFIKTGVRKGAFYELLNRGFSESEALTRLALKPKPPATLLDH